MNKMFSIYPNPNFGQFTLSIPHSNTKTIDIFVYDAMGKIVFQKTQTKEFTIPVDISSYSKGIYLMKVSDGENVKMSKVIHQ